MVDATMVGTHGPDEPRRIGPFRILEEIGAGGMGVVYLAERRVPIEQIVALKVIRADRFDRIYRARFAMEQEALARMDHPHVARLLDAGEDAGQLWFAMEHVPGVPIDRYCREHRLSVEARLALFAQVCDGVQHAHWKGILHRDLKPGNILVREVDGKPCAKIIDFGLARPVDALQIRATLHESLRQVVGTYAYMSPEQALGGGSDLDLRTDVYSLGVVLYELLTGELPLEVERIRERGLPWLAELLREHEPQKPSTRLSSLGERLPSTAAERSSSPGRLCARVRGELDWVTMRALARERGQRYESARELGRDLERWLRNEPVSAGPPGAWYVLRKWGQRHAGAVLGMAAVVVVTAVAGLVAWRSALRAERAEALRNLVARAHYAGELVSDSEQLWPLDARIVPALRHWLQEAEQTAALAQRLRALVDTDPAVGPGGVDAGLVQRGLERLAALAALQPLVAARLQQALVAETQTVVAYAEAWRQAQAAVAADARFAGFSLREQVGLVPIGPDPTTGLQEFVLLCSAATEGPAPVPERRAGRLAVGPHSGLVFVLLPGGGFSLPAGDRQVLRRLEPFLIGKHEMTAAQWARLAGEGLVGPVALEQAHPSNVPDFLQRHAGQPGEPRPDDAQVTWDAVHWVHPVQQVSASDAVAMLRRWGLALPTAAQWLFAANGVVAAEPQLLQFDWLRGPIGRWANGYDAVTVAALKHHARLGTEGTPSASWDGFAYTCPVDALEPNGFGLFSMFGNVGEFVRDAYGEDHAERANGPEQTTVEAAKPRQRALTYGGTWNQPLATVANGPSDKRGALFEGRQMPRQNIDPTVGVRPVWVWR